MTIADRIMARPPAMRRTLAVLLLPLAVLAVWALVFIPLEWVTTSQATWRHATRVELARARAHAQLLPSLREQLEKLPAQAVWQRFYGVAAARDASAALQRDVSGLCTSAGLANQTISQLPSEPEGPLMKYSVRVSASGTSDQLETFVAKVRQHPRYLRAQRLSITAPQMQSREQNPVLTITMDIAGYSGATPAPGTATASLASGHKAL